MNRTTRYALLTVDTEALSRRAAGQHVQRLVWGEHLGGTAGIRELCRIGNDFHIKHIFFVDPCGAYENLGDMLTVIRWLDDDKQDIQLHTHPEALPSSFWREHGLSVMPRYMNQYSDDARAEFVIRHFSEWMSEVTGKPVLAHRAGSFRWNAHTLRALHAVGIPVSFNNSMRAGFEGRSPLAQATNHPFVWSNGVIEVPVTERWVPSCGNRPDRWVSLTYPSSPYFRYPGQFSFYTWPPFTPKPPVTVFLLHSWSLLHRDEKGHAVYRDDSLLEGYRRLVSRIAKDYDVITTPEFLDLVAQGKLSLTHTVNIEEAVP